VVKEIGVFCLVTALFAVAFRTFLDVQPVSDLNSHIAYAERIRSAADISSPHFLFQLMVKAIAVTGVGHLWSAVLVLGAAYGAMAVAIVRELARRGGTVTNLRVFLIVPSLLVASHIFLFTLWRENMYYGYFVPIAYHNPTQQIGKLFALWIYFRYSMYFLEDRTPAPAQAASIGALAALSAIAKPSFLLAFLPSAGLIALRDLLRMRWRSAALFAFGIALPVSALLLWQAQVAYGGSGSVRIIVAPFAVFDARETLYKLPLSLAFPLLVGALAWRARIDDPRLRFVGMQVAFGLGMTLLLAEAGYVPEGNFAWTGQTVVFLAYVECLLVLLLGFPRGRWKYLAWSVYALHVASGIIWYAAVFFPERPRYL
jgi:hypothetical protein